jgi:hypothetical protein
MSVFCSSCGQALDGARFCRFCGADSSAALPVSPGATTSLPGGAGVSSQTGAAAASTNASAKSSNTLLIVIVICVVIFGGLAGVLMYAAYWAKNKVTSTAKNYGIELPNDSHSRGRKSAVAQRDPCSFLTAGEVATATGIGITEAHAQEYTCNFASADGTGAGAFVEFEWGSGNMLMTATRGASKLMAMAPGTEIQSVDGVGDEAYFQNGMLTVRRGEDGFRIMMPAELLSRNLGARTMLQNIADMRDIEKGLAEKIVGRM